MQQAFGDNSMSISRIKEWFNRFKNEITNEIGISIGSIHAILTKGLGLNRVSAKFVPKLLTMEQKQWCANNAQDMMDTANSDPNFLKTVITGDETSVYGYDPETKMQSSQWQHSTSPRPKTSKTSLQQCQDHVDCFL
ncbi:hypothetical protein C0J52_23219 [Blattella germanica]|nr:hypothetical protein C0J52_23219 [Blattella germanica]